MKSLIKVASVLCISAVAFVGCNKKAEPTVTAEEEKELEAAAAAQAAEASKQAEAAPVAEVAEVAPVAEVEPAAPVDEIEAIVREAAEIAEKVDGVKPTEEEIQEMLTMFKSLPEEMKAEAIAGMKQEIEEAKAKLQAQE
ncbi:MAG: hypothetical protein IJQ34_01085 [Kiritimatiellae bacterium]|nr:hypothetical protein [Kiritimatiellia bacterium]